MPKTAPSISHLPSRQNHAQVSQCILLPALNQGSSCTHIHLLLWQRQTQETELVRGALLTEPKTWHRSSCDPTLAQSVTNRLWKSVCVLCCWKQPYAKMTSLFTSVYILIPLSAHCSIPFKYFSERQHNSLVNKSHSSGFHLHQHHTGAGARLLL